MHANDSMIAIASGLGFTVAYIQNLNGTLKSSIMANSSNGSLSKESVQPGIIRFC